jgi:hypothetical protein
LATDAVFLSSHEDDEGPEILGRKMFFYENEHMMGFKLTNTGLQMILDIEVPYDSFPFSCYYSSFFRKK